MDAMGQNAHRHGSQPLTMAAPELLVIRQLSKRFGGLHAIDGLDLTLHEGQIFSIIGPNGAGKSTLFNLISGISRPDHGQILFDGENVTGMRPHTLVQKGLTRTFQNIRLFKDMSVLENVMIALHCRTAASLLDVALARPSEIRERKAARAKAEEVLELVQLGDRRHDAATVLAYGAQRRLELARALASQPRLVLLDEPTAGMNEPEVRDMIQLIQTIRDQGRTILLIEHNMPVVMGISDRIAVLSFGRKLAEDTPGAIRRNPEVISAYLGEAAEPTAD
jgi:branched-chain amino acid transport system ATP-binding protein